MYLNGEFVSYSEAKIPVEDRSIQFGDSVYEVVRYYRKNPFRIEQHMRRLQRSADMIELPLPPIDGLVAAMGEVIRREGLEDATVYIQVSRGVASRFHGVPTGLTPTVIALANPAPIVRPKPFMSCVTIGDTRWSQPYIKTTLLLPNAMAREHARRMGADDAIMVRDGLLTEASAFQRIRHIWRSPGYIARIQLHTAGDHSRGGVGDSMRRWDHLRRETGSSNIALRSGWTVAHWHYAGGFTGRRVG